LLEAARGISSRPWVFGEIALGVGICDTDINDAISTAGPKTTDTTSPGFHLGSYVAGNCGLIWSNSDVTVGQLACINGSLRTADGTIALEARSATRL
jgi:hypothetical protein